MKYINVMEKVALSVKGFPFSDLEVDYKEVDGVCEVTLHWVDGDKCITKHLASIKSRLFPNWVVSYSAQRYIYNTVDRIANPTMTYNEHPPISKDFFENETPTHSVYKNGELVRFSSPTNFAKQEGIPIEKVRMMIGKTLILWNGYSCFKLSTSVFSFEKTEKEGEILNESLTLHDMCLKHSIPYPDIVNLISGVSYKCQGWRYIKGEVL